MIHRLAAGAVAGLTFGLNRMRRDDRGQATVEYAGLAMAVGSVLGGKDHGIGAIVVDAVKSAVERAAGGAK
jgi:hypothetical protein